MSIYDANYFNQLYQFVPNNKRLSKWVNWLIVLITPIQWLRDKLINYFKVGDLSIAQWSNSATYAKDDIVEYLYKTYISLQDSNTDLPTSGNWELITNNWIGIDNRVLFTANKGTFEYALNMYFRGHWCALAPTGGADIWIETNILEVGSFRVGYLGEQSSNVGRDKSSEPIAYEPAELGDQYAFTIWVQEDLWADLANTNEERESIVRQFADRYNIAGLYYNILQYSGHLC